MRVPGFYDGDGIYRVRFMPDNEGEWTYRTRSKTAALDGKTGSASAWSRPRRAITARSRSRNRHPFRLCRRHALFSLRHDLLCLDASAARDAGADARDAEEDALQQDAHGRLPEGLPLQRQRAAARLLPARARTARKTSTGRIPSPSGISRARSRRCRDLGIEADIIIFHPYDRWGYCNMSAEQDFRYVAYLDGTARRLPQRLVVARQRIRLPARHQADEPVGSLLPHHRGERSLPAPEVDPQRRRER